MSADEIQLIEAALVAVIGKAFSIYKAAKSGTIAASDAIKALGVLTAGEATADAKADAALAKKFDTGGAEL